MENKSLKVKNKITYRADKRKERFRANIIGKIKKTMLKVVC